MFGLLVVVFADEFVVLHEVELVPRVELSLAEDAGEAVEVVHVVLGPPHHLGGGDPLSAPRALGAEPSGGPGQFAIKLLIYV